MKQVTFNYQQKPVREYSIENLRDEVIVFLSRNGMADSSAPNFVKIVDGEIHINGSCANSAFTRALALLQLIFSEPDTDPNEAPGYIVYKSDTPGFFLRLRGYGSWRSSSTQSYLIELAIDYIKEHTSISVK